MILVIATSVALVLICATVLLLRTLFKTCISLAELHDRIDFSWKDYRPIQRLLAPADFEFLRNKGISEDMIKKLRTERRKLYRLCLRSLARDFNNVHRALALKLAYSREDRSDLASLLVQQRIAFYRNLLRAEFQLTLHACGFDTVPQIDLLGPLETLREQVRAFASVNMNPALEMSGAAWR